MGWENPCLSLSSPITHTIHTLNTLKADLAAHFLTNPCNVATHKPKKTTTSLDEEKLSHVRSNKCQGFPQKHFFCCRQSKDTQSTVRHTTGEFLPGCFLVTGLHQCGAYHSYRMWVFIVAVPPGLDNDPGLCRSMFLGSSVSSTSTQKDSGLLWPSYFKNPHHRAKWVNILPNKGFACLWIYAVF